MTKLTVNKLEPKTLYDTLRQHNIEYFCGVPDSLLSSFSFFLEENVKESHDIAANEGNAIGMAIGYHIATGKIPLIYMQNSGFNNAIDPLTSLVDKSVMSIPMVLLISWRGQFDVTDEPQHVKQGAITKELLKLLDIPFSILSPEPITMQQQIVIATKYMSNNNQPYAFLIVKDTFTNYELSKNLTLKYPLSREEALELIVANINKSDVIVSGIGKVSRELFEYRESKSEKHDRDLLIVGGMGHASSISLAIALQRKNLRVYCIDGDGSVLMHMGALSIIGNKKPKNFYHIVMNNGSHDSVGGQPTVAYEIDIPEVALTCGYKHVYRVSQETELKDILIRTKELTGPIMIEIRLHGGARPNLTRPSIPPIFNKQDFMEFLNKHST